MVRAKTRMKLAIRRKRRSTVLSTVLTKIWKRISNYIIALMQLPSTFGTTDEYWS